jgi:uncharacterized membrane protein
LIIRLDRWIYRFSGRWLAAFNCVMVSVALAVVLAPVFRLLAWDGLADGLYRSFSGVCHQDPARSFHLGGHPLACCERCAAVYASLALSGLLFALVRREMRRPRYHELVLLLSPMVLDGMAVGSGLYGGNPVMRVVTGSLFGFGLIWLLYPRFEAGFAGMRARLEALFERLVAQGRTYPLGSARK